MAPPQRRCARRYKKGTLNGEPPEFVAEFAALPSDEMFPDTLPDIDVAPLIAFESRASHVEQTSILEPLN